MSDTVKLVIEIPEGSNVKCELNEEGELEIDRVLPTSMHFPMNYCSVKNTLGEDGDPLDALLFISRPTFPGAVIEARVIGVLEMEDEEGIDHKIVCVPVKPKVDPICGAWTSLDDIHESKKNEIRHFFEHYKDLEPEKWVKLRDWQPADRAMEIVNAARERVTTK
jgi:inorganic pyrophosphatase